MAGENQQEMLIRLQVEAGDAIKKMETASKSVETLTTAANKSASPMKQLQQNVRNASYQFTDFVVQVQGGQSAMLAFSQQAPQLLAGFGAIGAGIGLVAALVPSVIKGFEALTKDALTLEEATKGAETALKGLKDSFDFTTRKSLDPLIEQYKEADKETRNLILSNLELNVAIAKVAANDLKTSLRDSIQAGIDELGFFKRKWIELQDTFKNRPGFGETRSYDRKPEEALKTGFGIDQQQLDNIKQLQADFNAAKISATDFFSSVSKIYLATEKPTKDFTAWVQNLQKATKAQRELEVATKEYEAATERIAKGNLTTVKAEEKAKQEWEKATDKEIDKITKQFEALDKLREQRKKEAQSLLGAVDPLEAYANALEKARVLLNDNIISMKQYNDIVYRAQTVLANSNKLVNGLGDSLSNAFQGALIGGKSFSQVMNTLAQDIQAAIIKIMIIEPLIRQLKLSMVGSGLFNFGGSSTTPTSSGPTPGYEGLYIGGTAANGKVVSNSRMTPFANGGVVNGPTIFPMANGAGLMGEAGPEAIMPLKRGADGKLGVASSGGSTVVNVYNQSGAQTEVNETTNSDGSRQIDIYIKQAVERMISTGGIDKTMQSTYGLNRVGRR
jgi:lambda family phage tail tape measure protein